MKKPNNRFQPTLVPRAAEACVHGDCVAVNRGADYVQHLVRCLAPEQGTGPDTAHRTIKLRLLARHTVPVSTAINEKLLIYLWTFPEGHSFFSGLYGLATM